jgi:hypothetical protein
MQPKRFLALVCVLVVASEPATIGESLIQLQKQYTALAMPSRPFNDKTIEFSGRDSESTSLQARDVSQAVINVVMAAQAYRLSPPADHALPLADAAHQPHAAQRRKPAPARGPRLRTCVAPGCSRRPFFANLTLPAGPIAHCGRHAPAGFLNALTRRCRADGCLRVPSFGDPGDGVRAFCLRHKAVRRPARPAPPAARRPPREGGGLAVEEAA